MENKKIGFIAGAFDMFNIGHLNMLRNAKEQCDSLVVGVFSDIFCESKDNKTNIINENDRKAIVSAIRYVDHVVLLEDEDVFFSIKKYSVNLLFVDRATIEGGVWGKYVEGLAARGFDVKLLDFEEYSSYNMPMYSNNSLSDIIEDREVNVIGYTTGVFDMFHIGHLNILRRAKEHCSYLIVGVSTDENVQSYKHKTPVVPFRERAAIVSAIRYVDKVVPQENMDKFAAWQRLRFDEMYHGDDWKGSLMFEEIERKLSSVGCKMVFLSHTEGISSSILREHIKKNN